MLNTGELLPVFSSVVDNITKQKQVGGSFRCYSRLLESVARDGWLLMF